LRKYIIVSSNKIQNKRFKNGNCVANNHNTGDNFGRNQKDKTIIYSDHSVGRHDTFDQNADHTCSRRERPLPYMRRERSAKLKLIDEKNGNFIIPYGIQTIIKFPFEFF